MDIYGRLKLVVANMHITYWSICSVGDGMTESLFWPVHDNMVLNYNNNKSINLTLQYYGQLPRPKGLRHTEIKLLFMRMKIYNT